jgi:hypothetical protein
MKRLMIAALISVFAVAIASAALEDLVDVARG